MTKLDRENLEDAAKIISESKDDPRFAEPFINELDKTNIDSWHSRDRIID